MAKLRYKYNPETLSYERYRLSGKTLRKKILVFLSMSLVLAVAGYYTTLQYFDSFDAMLLSEKNRQLKRSWSAMNKRVQKARIELSELVDKDDNNYRIILDSNPLDASIREAGTGGSERPNVKSAKEYPLIYTNYLALDKLEHQVDVEMQSYDELAEILNTKMVSWSTRPAIQPINNTQLITLHMTYGARLHPIFKVWKDHKGLDFAAPLGTPVYATGDGEVLNAYFSDSYGKVVFINHGYGFETRYAHLSQFAVIPGEPVKRGQVIGYVGDTGNSKGPHLHYEVLYHGEHVNPINFFQRDLSNSEYQKLIETEDKNALPLD